MLLEFRVKNFRSLRDEQVFSMVASKDKDQLQTHTSPTEVLAASRALNTAAIYGANASGKSNLVKAIQFMRGVVVESAALTQPGQTYDGLHSFRLDDEVADTPTEFEVSFISEGVRYEYAFSMTRHQIVGEHLKVYKAFKPQLWFSRDYDDAERSHIYKFGPALKGDKKLWERSTRENALFLSMAAQLNSAMVKPVFDWFLKDLVIFNEWSAPILDYTVQRISDPKTKEHIVQFLKSADISVDDIEVETKTVKGHNFQIDLATGLSEKRSQDIEQTKIFFKHRTRQGIVRFEIPEESHGTRVFFELAGPLLDILQNGKTVFFDEIERGLHPKLVEQIIALFHNPEVNLNGAQLIFTTHNTVLLDVYGLLRRDQIWFVEKDVEQATSIFPLTDFSPRKGEAIGRGYLQGRFGGLPFFENGLRVHHGSEETN